MIFDVLAVKVVFTARKRAFAGDKIVNAKSERGPKLALVGVGISGATCSAGRYRTALLHHRTPGENFA